MFGKALKRVASLPARNAEWTGRPNPVALLGVDGAIRGSGKAIIDAFTRSNVNGDNYTEVIHYAHDCETVEAPLSSAPNFQPVLNCGVIEPDAPDAKPTDNDWYKPVNAAVTAIVEKGYCPITVGGDGSTLLPTLESIKAINSEEMTIIHFGAAAELSTAMASMRVAQEKGVVKGIASLGNRCVDYESRQARKTLKVKYIDCQQLFMKGVFCVRDLLNEAPIFISINVSALDPAFAPGVRDPEGGGLTTRELLHILRGVRGPKLVGADIHGFDPELDVLRRDGLGLTAITASKLVKELVCKAYTTSVITHDEGFKGVEVMRRQGIISTEYPEY